MSFIPAVASRTRCPGGHKSACLVMCAPNLVFLPNVIVSYRTSTYRDDLPFILQFCFSLHYNFFIVIFVTVLNDVFVFFHSYKNPFFVNLFYVFVLPINPYLSLALYLHNTHANPHYHFGINKEQRRIT